MGWLNPLRRIFNWTLSSSTYDAVHAKNKRSAPIGILRSEDAELTPAGPGKGTRTGKGGPGKGTF